MFCVRDGLGPKLGSQIEGDLQQSAPSASLPNFTVQTARRPAIASLSLNFNQFLQTLPWNRGQRTTTTGSGAQLEPKTNTMFEEEFCQRGNRQCGSLAGVGARSKKIAGLKNINVYALGLYVDVPAAKGALQKYRGKSPAALVKDQDFYDALIKADHVDKTLHLSIAFGRVSSSQFWEAIREQLTGPMAKAGAEADLQAFARTFDGVKFHKGLPLSFCISKGGSLTSKIDGKDASTIHSKALCRSLLGVYLGKKPVSPDAKESIGTGLARILED